uniref:Uncharacterized protein n=1 Tax=Nelumbo nucifera TaxID=4432 RepID=A0A822ZEH3_NELNU|nr:TPA_asm: hypothetical protein HUJ06_001517 [Nelumbo nucifera]
MGWFFKTQRVIYKPVEEVDLSPDSDEVYLRANGVLIPSPFPCCVIVCFLCMTNNSALLPSGCEVI